MILDEIPHCLGRTGKMFTCEHYGVVPDMLVIGKGLGGGVFPLAALIAGEDLDILPDRRWVITHTKRTRWHARRGWRRLSAWKRRDCWRTPGYRESTRWRESPGWQKSNRSSAGDAGLGC